MNEHPVQRVAEELWAREKAHQVQKHQRSSGLLSHNHLELWLLVGLNLAIVLGVGGLFLLR